MLHLHTAPGSIPSTRMDEATFGTAAVAAAAASHPRTFAIASLPCNTCSSNATQQPCGEILAPLTLPAHKMLVSRPFSPVVAHIHPTPGPTHPFRALCMCWLTRQVRPAAAAVTVLEAAACVLLHMGSSGMAATIAKRAASQGVACEALDSVERANEAHVTITIACCDTSQHPQSSYPTLFNQAPALHRHPLTINNLLTAYSLAPCKSNSQHTTLCHADEVQTEAATAVGCRGHDNPCAH